MVPRSTVSRALLLLCLAGCEQILGISSPVGTTDATYADGFSVDGQRSQCTDGALVTKPMWGAAGNYSAPGGRGIAIGDLDQDTIPDVAVATDTDVLIFRGTGSGVGATRALHTGSATVAVDLVIADIDGDSRNDVVTWSGNTVAVHRQSSTMAGVFLAEQSFTTGSTVRIVPGPLATKGLRAGRINNDALYDLVIATLSETRVYISQVSTPGVLASGAQLATGDVGLEAVVDLDEDGYDDVVLGGMQIKVAFNTPASPGSFAPLVPVGPAGNETGATAGRFATGMVTRRDLAVFTNSSRILYTHQSPRVFVEHMDIQGFANPNGRLDTVDLNSDLHDDLIDNAGYVLLCEDHSAFFYGDGNLALPQSTESVKQQAFGDLNSNGKADLLRITSGSFLEVYLQ